MYCPKCAAPIDGVKYCRACGANVSLVPQALSGQLPAVRPEDSEVEPWGRHHRRRRHLGGKEGGISNAFMGLAFAIVAIILMRSHEDWGVWMLIPAFALLGKGVAQILSAKPQTAIPPAPPSPSTYAAPRTSELPSRHHAELGPPPSVVEDPTRRMDAAAESAEKKS